MNDLLTIGDIIVGLGSTKSVRVTRESIIEFGSLTGDENPLHRDDEFSKITQFKQINAQGMLITSYIVGIVGTTLPGRGWMCLGVNTNFHRPVFVNDVVTINLEVSKTIPVLKTAVLKAEVRNSDGELINSAEIKVKQLELTSDSK